MGPLSFVQCWGAEPAASSLRSLASSPWQGWSPSFRSRRRSSLKWPLRPQSTRERGRFLDVQKIRRGTPRSCHSSQQRAAATLVSVRLDSPDPFPPSQLSSYKRNPTPRSTWTSGIWSRPSWFCSLPSPGKPQRDWASNSRLRLASCGLAGRRAFGAGWGAAENTAPLFIRPTL